MKALKSFIIFIGIGFCCAAANIKQQDNKIILPGSDNKNTAQIYFLENISKQGIWIDHPLSRRGAGAGWGSFLRPGNISVLMINQKNFVLSCAIIQPGEVSYQNCLKVIQVSVPKNFQIKGKQSASYWLVEDKPRQELEKSLKARGICTVIPAGKDGLSK